MEGLRLTTDGVIGTPMGSVPVTEPKYIEVLKFLESGAPTGIAIDLQLDNFLKAYGHKIIYRRYQTGVKSSHYDITTKEGVGGSRWKYVDTPMLVRSSSNTSSRGTKGPYKGRLTYYLLAKYKPKVNDVIIEVQLSKNSSATADSNVLAAAHAHTMRIKDVDEKRGADGKIIFYQVYTEPDYGYY